MTSAFGGQRSIQLSYGCNRMRRYYGPGCIARNLTKPRPARNNAFRCTRGDERMDAGALQAKRSLKPRKSA
jgi:hypothetical protein